MGCIRPEPVESGVSDMRNAISAICVVAIVAVTGASATASVEIDTVIVGDEGNTGEWSGESYGGYGPDRVCGAVDYDYEIGMYEVTAGQYGVFLNAAAGTDPYGLYNTSMWLSSYGCKIERYDGSGTAENPYKYRVADDWADRPVNFVSWGDAARFANWMHNGQSLEIDKGSYDLKSATSDAGLLAVEREPDATWVIPTENEWYKAAYYKGGGTDAGYWDYPTGSDSIPSNDLVDPDDGNNATFRVGAYDYTIGSPQWRSEVGAHELSESPRGTFDQGGNVLEWNEVVVDDDNGQPIYRGLRGGSFDDTVGYLKASHRDRGAPTHESGEVGFRLARVPEPATLTLLAFGGLAALRKRRCFAHRAKKKRRPKGRRR